MKIYVDADACPVVRIVEKIASNYKVPCVLLCDTNHILRFDYSEVISVGAGADAVDFKLISLLRKGDICVPGEGNGNPLQYFFWDNPMDRGAWQATVHGVSKSWMCCSNQTTAMLLLLLLRLLFSSC